MNQQAAAQMQLGRVLLDFVLQLNVVGVRQITAIHAYQQCFDTMLQVCKPLHRLHLTFFTCQLRLCIVLLVFQFTLLDLLHHFPHHGRGLTRSFLRTQHRRHFQLGWFGRP